VVTIAIAEGSLGSGPCRRHALRPGDMANLRKKVEDDASMPRHLEVGIGY
jgi:hypothetical protein